MEKFFQVRSNHVSKMNPKRYLIDFVYHLIRAVHAYALYQRNKYKDKYGLFNGTHLFYLSSIICIINHPD